MKGVVVRWKTVRCFYVILFQGEGLSREFRMMKVILLRMNLQASHPVDEAAPVKGLSREFRLMEVSLPRDSIQVRLRLEIG